MAFRGVPIVETKEIIRLWLAGIPKKRIAARVGVDPKTVRHYVRAAEQAGLQQSQGAAALTEEMLCRVLVAVHKGVQRDRGTGWADCATHRDTIRKYLAQRVRLTKIRKLLQRQGVHVSYATLHRFAVLELEFGRSATTVPLLDCAPGEELQVDFAPTHAPGMKNETIAPQASTAMPGASRPSTMPTRRRHGNCAMHRSSSAATGSRPSARQTACRGMRTR